MESSIGIGGQSSNRDLLIAESEEQGVFFDLVRAASRLEGELNRTLRPYDLTTATYAILSILDRAGSVGLSCGDVAGQLIAEVPDMTRLLDRLERLEYVTRERSAHDRRMVRVKLTARGAEVVQNLKQVVTECHKLQFKSVPMERLQALRQGLKDLLKLDRGGAVSKGHEGGGRGGHLAVG
jgi:DNA-binding MarR family transcriptional regulator